MSLQISYEVSDRAEVEKKPGLHAVLYFKWSADEPLLHLFGVTNLTESVEQLEITVTDDEIGLDPELAKQLSRVVFEVGWNDIVHNDIAAVGVHWRDFDDWLDKCSFVDAEQVKAAVYNGVSYAMKNGTYRPKNRDSNP